jgi:hypothetical protein
VGPNENYTHPCSIVFFSLPVWADPIKVMMWCNVKEFTLLSAGEAVSHFLVEEDSTA